jgi:hypothetical protein
MLLKERRVIPVKDIPLIAEGMPSDREIRTARASGELPTFTLDGVICTTAKNLFNYLTKRRTGKARSAA